MKILGLKPYLFFDGRAEEAIRLYQEALGAEVVMMSRYTDMPADSAMACAPGDENRIMHAEVRIAEVSFWMSDTPTAYPPKPGSQISLSLEYADVSEMERRFEALAANGRVEMAPHDAFWGSRFGMLTDAMGIQWMLHAPQQ